MIYDSSYWRLRLPPWASPATSRLTRRRFARWRRFINLFRRQQFRAAGLTRTDAWMCFQMRVRRRPSQERELREITRWLDDAALHEVVPGPSVTFEW